MSEEGGSRATSTTASTQSTPTPPNGTKGRRLRKCATPIKSAEKVEKHERVTVRQGPPTLPIPSSTNSSASEATPSSSGATTPAKVEGETKVSMNYIIVMSCHDDVIVTFISFQPHPFVPLPSLLLHYPVILTYLRKESVSLTHWWRRAKGTDVPPPDVMGVVM